MVGEVSEGMLVFERVFGDLDILIKFDGGVIKVKFDGVGGKGFRSDGYFVEE